MSNQKSPHEEFIMFGLAAFIIGGLCWLIWHFFSVELTSLVRWIRVGELHLVQLIHGDDLAVNGQKASVWRKWLPRAAAQDITPQHIRISTEVAVWPLTKIFFALIMLMIVVVMFKGPGTHYHRRMNLEMLMREQAKSFPTIAPFLKFDPRKQPHRAPGAPVPKKLPLFAEALSPEEWLAYNQVKVGGGSRVDPTDAYNALALQLGKRWQGPLKLPVHLQGLYAAFALKYVRKRKQCDELLNALALSWSDKGGFKPSGSLVSQIRKIIKDPKVGGELKKYADQHAYETTALLRCLARAREEGGVLAPAQFVWLRGVDRNAWYPLNNLGRKSYHAEAAGAMVHYTNELIAGQRIPTPRFEEVVRGIETYLKSGMARAVPALQK